MRYKEASGFGYSKITFFLEVQNVIADLREVIESDSHSDDDDDDNSFTATASQPTSGENELVEISQKSEKDPCEVTMMVNCPTCGRKYPVSEIEEHADLCADYSVEQPDPLPVDKAATPTLKDQGKILCSIALARRIIIVNKYSIVE